MKYNGKTFVEGMPDWTPVGLCSIQIAWKERLFGFLDVQMIYRKQ